MLKLLKRIKCFMCCGSKCSLNDVDGDGIIDEIKIETNNNKECINQLKNLNH